MNENVHNIEVATFQEKVKNHENAIIEGTKVAHDLNDFIELNNELCGILEEKTQLYNKDKSKKNAEELDSFLREELDYLDLIDELMTTLEQYHDVVGLVDTSMIIKEWEDVRVIVTYKNLEKNLKRVNHLMKTYSDEKYTELSKSIVQKQEKLLKRMTEAEHNMISRSETDMNTTLNDEITPNIDWNEKAFENMDIKEKIQYIEQKMTEIEQARGKKRTLLVGGERKNIAKKYVARYLKYNSMLNNLNVQLREEQQALEELNYRIQSQVEEQPTLEELSYRIQSQVEDEISEELIYEYYSLREEMKEIDSAISLLIVKANGASEQDIIHITLPNGNTGCILKSDLNVFEQLEEKAYSNYDVFSRFMQEQEISSDDVLGEKTPEEKKTEILEKIHFLRVSGVTGDALNEEVKKLIDEYRKIEKRKKFISMAGLTRLFMNQGYSKDEAHQLAFITYDPDAYYRRKEKTDEEKKNVFSKLFQSLSASIFSKNEAVVEEYALVYVDAKKNSFASLYNVGINVAEYVAKIIKAMKRIPSKVGHYVSKIKNIRKPKNKSVLKENVKKRVRQSAVVMGFMAMLTAASVSQSKNSAPVQNEVSIDKEDENKNIAQDVLSKDDINQIAEELGDKIYDMTNKEEEKAEIEEQPSSDPNLVADSDADTIVPEENSVYIGDIFTTKMDADIYTNMYDAANETNGLHAYFSPESLREVTGIVYNYNGTTIILDEKDPDFEAQKKALESNGAELVAVRSENKSSNETGVAEGYWNIEDINIENEEGIQR